MRFWRWVRRRNHPHPRAPTIGVVVAIRTGNLPAPAIGAHGNAREWPSGGLHHYPHQDEEELERMAKDRTLAIMCDAGRLYLQSTPDGTPDDYAMKQAMARAAPTHDALQQQQAIATLKIERQANTRRKK